MSNAVKGEFNKICTNYKVETIFLLFSLPWPLPPLFNFPFHLLVAHSRGDKSTVCVPDSQRTYGPCVWSCQAIEKNHRKDGWTAYWSNQRKIITLKSLLDICKRSKTHTHLKTWQWTDGLCTTFLSDFLWHFIGAKVKPWHTHKLSQGKERMGKKIYELYESHLFWSIYYVRLCSLYIE